jgi:hypothetical protein
MIFFIYLGMVHSFPIMADEEEYNEDTDHVVGVNSFRHVFSRHETMIVVLSCFTCYEQSDWPKRS